MPDDARLPSIPLPSRSLEDVGGSALPPSLQILLDEGLYTRMKQLSGLMAKAEGFTPRHLLGKPEACFAIINTSLDWKLNPHFTARHTYQTPGGSIGFDGALVQSVLERSGRFVGAPEFEYRGDWEKLTGKFEKKTSGKGNEYVVGTWTDDDAVGLGIIVRWQVRGESRPRVWPGETTPFWLTQCYPRNSPLWATDPKTQIAYLAIRRFANQTAPGILGAASFDYDDMVMAGELARDVTPPRPRPEDYATEATQASTEQTEAPARFQITDSVGEVTECATPKEARSVLLEMIKGARSAKELEDLWENNTTSGARAEIADFDEVGEAPLLQAYDEARTAFEQKASDQSSEPAGTPGQTEHPEGRQDSISGERSPLASSPTKAAARGAPTALSEALRNLAAAANDPEASDQKVKYWVRMALDKCVSPVETDDVFRPHEKRILRMDMSVQKEVREMVKAKARELSAF